MGRKLILVVVLTVAALAVVALLFTVVFPWFDRAFFADPVVGHSGVARPWLPRG